MSANRFDWRTRHTALVAFRVADGHHLRDIEGWLHSQSPTGWRDSRSMWISFECLDDAEAFVTEFGPLILVADGDPPPPPPTDVTICPIPDISALLASMKAISESKKRRF